MGTGSTSWKRARLKSPKDIGGQKIVIETLKENDIFGEIAYIDKTPRSATATAKGTTVVGTIDRDYFDAEFNKLSADFQKVLKTVAFRLRKIMQGYVAAKNGKRRLILDVPFLWRPYIYPT